MQDVTKAAILELISAFADARCELQTAVACIPASGDTQSKRDRCAQLLAEIDTALDQYALKAARHWA